ncbi:MAG: response regulator [Gammaproteobacteria bacterium]|nr:response regulator [Gammaproteobacteria bacterium]
MKAWFKALPSPSPKARIALGLSSIAVSLLLVAGLVGLIPNKDALVMEGRAAVAEAIAVNTSVFITRSDLSRMESNLLIQMQRHPELKSAGVRHKDGRLVVATGDHRQVWKPMEEGKSTNGQLIVPIWEGDVLWGSVELTFTPLRGEGLVGYLQDPFLQLLFCVGLLSFVIFYFYLGKMLEQLDPSQAIPERVRSALDTMAEGLLVLDARKNIVLANEAFATLVNADAAALFGVKVSRFEWQVDNVAANDDYKYPWETTLEENRVQRGQIVRLPTAANNLRTFMVNCSPVLGGDGNAAGVMVSFDDVTELEEKEIELRKSKEEADLANRAKSDFLANMSHEIRTPMNAILGFTEVLKRGYGKNRQESAKYLNTIASSGEHLLGLINDILDLSKVEAGQMEVEQISCSLHHVIHEVIQIMRVKADEKQLTVRYQPDGPMPEQILSDPARVRQILTNLIGNAIKFTEQGGITVTSKMVQRGDENFLQLEIIDTGIGMTESQASAIFQPFVQADSSITRRFGGTGLGLTISKRFAEALGGDISARSEQGQGSTFTVLLKYESVAGASLLSPEQLLQVEHVASEAEHVSWKFPAAKVLVVDDGQENRNLLEVVLADAGLQVDVAENGQQACEALFSSPYDLVLMDVQMPVMDGYEAAAMMREKGYTLPIVALTAHAMKGAEEKCLQAGYSGYMTKPINIEKLMTMLAQELGGVAVAEEAELEGTDSTIATADRQSAATTEAAPLRSTLALTNPTLRSIVERFVTRLGEQLQLMRAAYEGEQMPKLAELAHWLKGSGGSVGFADFTQPAAELEEAAKSGQREQVSALLAQLAALYERIDLLKTGTASQVEAANGDSVVAPGNSADNDSADNIVNIKSYPSPERIQSTLAASSSRFHPIIVKFQQRLEQRLVDVEASLAACDFEEVAQFAHWLKGSAGSVGYSMFTEPALDLELAAKEANAPVAKAIYKRIAEMVKRIEPISDVS